jgi:serine-type D-Ala-D-Ala carboxypeptidase/endopeptidase
VDHTSALPDNLPVPSEDLKKMKPQDSTFRVNEILAHYTVADMLRDLSQSTLDRRPGTEPRHSNVSMEVLAVMLENIYHDSYPHLLSHYVEKPFGMAGGVGYARRRKFATGYDEEHREMPFYTGKIAIAAGGLRYSPQDMAGFLQGELSSSDPAIHLSHQAQWGKEEDGAFAFDWFLERSIDSQLRLRSSGGTFAFSSYIEMYPGQRYGVVLLANRMNYTGNTQGELQQPSEAARAAIWGKPAAQVALESELQRSDYQEIAATVAKVRAAHPELLLTENYVNAWGYRLAGEKQFSAAIRLFQYNVATFPKSWNVWDSLAEGYEMSGDKQDAIDNYWHSLEINPGNTHGAEALKRLNAAQ